MKLWMKAVISAVLIALLIWKSSPEKLVAVIAETDLNKYAAAFLLFLFQQVVVAYCWQILLVAQKNRVPFVRTLEVHFVGSFFGTFLPSSIGMDIVRAYRLSRYLRHGVDAASSMFVTRVVGFLVNYVLALVVAIPVSRAIANPHLFWTVVGLTLAFIAAIWVTLHRWSLQIVNGLLHRMKLIKLADKLAHFRTAILQFTETRSAMLKLLALSLFFQVFGVFIIFTVGRAVAIDLDLWYYFIYIPLITAITVLPISLAGIGIREGAFVFFFTQAGVLEAQALSLALLLFSQSLLMAMMGGIWYLLDKNKVQAMHRRVKQEVFSETE
jgi:hypothetical protein